MNKKNIIFIFIISIFLIFTGCKNKKDEKKEIVLNKNIPIKKEIVEDSNIDNPIISDNNSTNNTTNGQTSSTTKNNTSNNNTTKKDNKTNNTNIDNTTTSKNQETVKYGKVLLKYIDEENNKIINDKTDTNVKIGTTYNYQAPKLNGYTISNTNQNIKLDKENQTKEITFRYGNIDYVPYISTYYIKPSVKTGEEVFIKFYVTDYFQKEFIENDNSKNFIITIKVDGKNDIVKTVKSGVNTISIGSFTKEGNIDFSILATDELGRNSHELFNYFRVFNGIAKKEYVMTNEDLVKYNIKNDDSYAIRRYVDFNAIDDTIIEPMQQRYNSEVVPSKKYVVLIPRNVNDNNKFGYRLYRYVKVKYASDYDMNAVYEESAKTREGLQKLLDDKAKEGFNYIKLLNGIYRVDHTKTIYVPSNLTLDLNNATIKQNQFTGDSAYMMSLESTYDSHIINGNFEGDYYEHDYINSPNNSEWPLGVGLNGQSDYSSIENVNIRDITGYGLVTGMSKTSSYTYFSTIQLKNFKFMDIDRKSGKEITSVTRATSDIEDISSIINASKYLQISKYLGYQGMLGNSWNMIVHFYNSNKELIKSIDSYQYRRIRIPEGSKYIRVTMMDAKGVDLSIFNDLKAVYFKLPTNSWVSNVLIDNARCVGMAPSHMSNMLFTNMEFKRNGQSGAFSAMDAEDGWDNMQDITFRNLNFHDNYRNDFLTCAGHNFVVENLIHGDLSIYSRTNGFVYENNNNYNRIKIASADRKRNGYYRVQNDNFDIAEITVDEREDYLSKSDWSLYIKNSTIKGKVTTKTKIDDSTKKHIRYSGKFIGCTFNIDDKYNDQFNNALGKGYYKDCIINGASGENYGGYYVNSTLNNVTGNLHSTFQFENCILNNFNVNSGGYDPHIYIENCKINNFSMNNNYYLKGNFFEVRDSTIINNSPFLTTCSYSTEQPVKFINNKITLNTDKGLINFHDDRDNGTYERSYYLLENNEFKTDKSKYIFTDLTLIKNNPINIIISNNTLNNDLKLVEPTIENYSNVKITKK